MATKKRKRVENPMAMARLIRQRVAQIIFYVLNDINRASEREIINLSHGERSLLCECAIRSD